MLRFLKALWLTVFFVFSLAFFMQNKEALSENLSLVFKVYYTDYTWTNTEVPFFVVVLIAFGVGVLVTLGYLIMDRLRLKREVSRCRRIVRNQEKELKKLRAIPLETTPLLESPDAGKPAPVSESANVA